jgi:hypothetical protein
MSPKAAGAPIYFVNLGVGRAKGRRVATLLVKPAESLLTRG